MTDSQQSSWKLHLIAFIATACQGTPVEVDRDDPADGGEIVRDWGRPPSIDANLDRDASAQAGDVGGIGRKDAGVDAIRDVSVADAQNQPEDLGSPPECSVPYEMELVWIEGGSIVLTEDVDRNLPFREADVHSFMISRTEVTAWQFQQCVDAGVCAWGDRCHLDTTFQSCPNVPAACVTWRQACNFARWVGGRLPTVAEFEFAGKSRARFSAYPWGEEPPSCERTICGELFDDRPLFPGCGGRIGTWPVCSRPLGHSLQGVCDLSGNVSEWLIDGGEGDAPNPLPNEIGCEPLSERRVIRGGSYDLPSWSARTDYGYFWEGERPWPFIGFRVVRMLPE